MRFSTSFAVIISLVCNCGLGVICSVTSIWWIPFAITPRIMCHFISILPNGLSVDNGSYPFDIKIIIIGLLITVILYLLISYISAKWFEKQEI